MRSSLAHIRQSRIAPSAIDAPPQGFVPQPLGAGLPNEGFKQNHGLQEERVERDAWQTILEALTRLKSKEDNTEKMQE